MSDKQPSTLAVAHNHSHRPGGCVGSIFFHLFNWNKRFAKRNKLFSRKLLPPGRTKPSKRFGGDEKMPKTALHLMPDHTHLLFSNPNKSDNPGSVCLDHQNEVRSPSLVARLMGLESLPAVCPDKPNKPSRATSVLDMRDKTHCPRYNGEDLILERGYGQIEPRPQKIQRTGSLERRAVTRLGADSFQLKAVLSRPRKHHHPKLPSSIKSPRLSTSRSASRTSRLIGAATRILEPGLQATNKARSSLTYSTSFRYSSEDKITSQGMTALSADRSLRASHEISRNQPSTGQTSCKNCGTLINAAVSSPLDEQGSGYSSLASDAVSAPSHMHDDTFPSHFPQTSFNISGDVMFQRSQARPVSFTRLNENSKQCETGLDVYRVPACQDGQAVWDNVMPQKNEHLICASKLRPQTQTQSPANVETLAPRAKFIKNENKRSSAVNAVNHQAKDFVAINRNLSRYMRPRVTSKIEGSHFLSKKISRDGVGGSVIERGNASFYRQIQNRGFYSSSHGIDTKLRNDVVIAKQMLTAHPRNQAVTESRSAGQRNTSRCKGTSDRAVNFPFNSTSDKRGGSYVGRNGKRKDRTGGSGRVTALQIKINSDEAKSLQSNVPRTEDGLAVLTELKFKVLTSQEEDEVTAKHPEPKRSTAMIHELIYALSAEHGTCQDSRFNNSDAASQTEEDALISWAQQFDHQSPGSVLEASFSNDSCVSSSLDDNSGHCRYTDSTDYPVEGTGFAESDEDISDSAASLKEGVTSSEMVTHLVDQISRRLSSIDEHALQLSGGKLTHVKEVMGRIEVLLGKPAEVGSWDGILLPFVKDEVETLAEAMQLDSGSLLGVEQTNQQLRRFMFDCAIECIESKYGHCHSVGYQVWRRLALSMKCGSFIQEVGRAMRKWSNFAGMVCDELMEWEMSDFGGKRRELESEVFEAGREIDGGILEGLVEEVVVELWEDRAIELCASVA